MKKLIIMMIFWSCTSLAGTGSGKITAIYAHEKNGGDGVVLFGTASNSNKPGCSVGGGGKEWAIDVNTDQGKAMYSLLLAAAASGTSVNVTGTGQCTSWPDREQPKYILVTF